MTQAATERQEMYRPAFDAFRRQPAFGGGGLARAREAAFARFLERGFPTTRDEDWRFTNVSPIASGQFEPASTSWRTGGAPALDADAIAPWLFGETEAHRLVLVNGRKADALSTPLPAGVTLSEGAAGDPDQLWHHDGGHAFADLNTAFFDSASIIEIAPGTVVEAPLYVLLVSAGDGSRVMATPRLVIRAGAQSQVSIVETYVATGQVFTNAITDLHCAAGAVVRHVKLQRQAASTFHIGSMFNRLDRGATLTSYAVTLGARIARNDIFAVLDGDGAECTLDGLYVAGGDSLVDTHTTIDHAKPHCPSHEVYKGILTGRARAVFNGKIVVRQDAQKTNAKQTNKALLLTDDAQVNTKPQLEIFADDVKCTHGAAIGQIDEDAMFYLRARGISHADARTMLIHAFAGDVLDGIAVPAVRETARQLVEELLG